MSAAAEATRGLLACGLYVARHGDPARPAVVLSAGLGGGGGYWDPQLEALAADHHVIVYDHRGTGRSDRAPLPSGYTVTHMAHDILALMDELAIARAHIVGHAAGGLAALALARSDPERVISLVVVNGWAVAEPHFRRCLEIRRAILAQGGVDAYLKAQPLFLYPAEWINRHLDALDRGRADHAADFQDVATLDARIGALTAFNMRDDLGAVTSPALLVVSEDDMLVPPSATDRLARGLPDAAVARMTWGGHAANVTDPVAFNQILIEHLRSRRGA